MLKRYVFMVTVLLEYTDCLVDNKSILSNRAVTSIVGEIFTKFVFIIVLAYNSRGVLTDIRSCYRKQINLL